MKLEHVAVWTRDIDRLRAFYERWFGALGGARYYSRNQHGFTSCFLTFPEGGARLELMSAPDLGDAAAPRALGYAHLAVSLGSVEAVEALATRMREAGVPVLDGPRRTGDGYFEAVIEDPDGNRVEITA